MTTATETQPTKHTNDCVRQQFKFGARSKAGDVCSCGGITTQTKPAITLSNFRVTYQAPRYDDGKVLYDGYCAILADSAEHDGAEVRVFDVPDVDEGQLAAAMFACDAMNQHERLIKVLRDEIAALEIWQGMKLPPDIRNGIQISLSKLRTALATTSK